MLTLSGCTGPQAGTTTPSAASPSDAGPVALKVVSQFGDNPALQKVLDDLNAKYQAEHSNVTVEIQYLTLEDLTKTLPTSLASGSGPDIFDYDAAALTDLVKSDLVADLSAPSQQYGWATTLTQSAAARTTIDEKLYGVPRSTEGIGLFVNADLLKKHNLAVPTDYSSFLSAAQGLKAAGVQPIAFGNKDQWPSSHLLGATIHAAVPIQTIAGFETLAGTGTWSQADVVTGLSLGRDLVTKGYVPKDFNGISFDDALKSFFAGKAAMFVEGTGVTPDVLANMPDADVEFVPFPMAEAAMPQQAAGGVGGAWAISAASANVAAAADWVNYVHFSETAEAAWLKAGVLPTTNFAVDSVDVPDLVKQNAQVLQKASSGGGIGFWTGYANSPLVTDAWTSNAQLFLNGDQTAEQFTAKLDQALADARADQ